MEFELVLHPDDAAKVLHLPTIESAKAGRIRTQPMRIIWHDSPDRRVAADGLALAEHRGMWQLERLAPGAEEIWPPGALPPLLAEADTPSGLSWDLAEPLAPVAAFEGKSTTALLAFETDSVSLVMLRGALRTVTAEHPVCRVRLSGADAPVRVIAMALAGALRATIPRASLASEALATAAGSVIPPRRLGAPALAVAAQAAVTLSFRHVLGHLTDVILYHAPTVVAGMEDTEPLHQMRVAVRRARSAISIYRHALGCPAYDAVNAHLKTLGSRLAPARDWDVFVTETAPAVAAALPHDAKLSQLIGAAHRKRREVHATLQGWLTSPEFRVLGIELAWLAASDDWTSTTAPTVQETPGAASLPEFAVAILHRRWRKVLAAGKQIETLDIAALHGLRLRTKRARYAAEIFATLFQVKAANKFLHRLNTLQTTLGNLNDAAVAEHLLRDVGGGTSRHGYAIGLILGFAAASTATIRPRILRAWSKFERQPSFWA